MEGVNPVLYNGVASAALEDEVCRKELPPRRPEARCIFPTVR
jgi:hypothetical protein